MEEPMWREKRKPKRNAEDAKPPLQNKFFNHLKELTNLLTYFINELNDNAELNIAKKTHC